MWPHCFDFASGYFQAVTICLHSYYLWPIWLFLGGWIFITFGHFGHFQVSAFVLFLAILDDCVCIIFGHLWAAAFLSFSPILAILGGLCVYFFLPFWIFSGGSFSAIFRQLHFFFRPLGPF